MAEKFRDPETYRWARRNRWCELKAHYGVSWAEFNQPQARPEYSIGTPPVTNRLFEYGRSKYRPHQGKREMERRRQNAQRSL